MRKGRRKGETGDSGWLDFSCFVKCVRRGYAIIVIAGIKRGVNAQCGEMRAGVNCAPSFE